MHVVTNTIRRGDRVYTAHLLRRSYREGGRVKKQTLANLSHLPDELVELMELRPDLSAAITRRVPLEAAAINAVLDELASGTSHVRTVIDMVGR